MDLTTNVPFDNTLFKFTSHFPNLIHYYYYENMFTVKECEQIINTFTPVCNIDGTIFSNNEKNYRKTKITWIPNNHTTKWIYDRFIDYIKDANMNMFKFDITTFRDLIQFGLYDSSFNGHYGRHVDLGHTGDSSCRKLSISVQLSDCSEYTGGDLILKNIIAPKKQGCAVVFPSYLEHEVTPVTTGKRYSLVLWIYGPPFR